MRQLTFYKDAVLKLDGEYASDHNRSPLDVSYDRIEDTVRTQRGSLRRYYTADKRSISCSWSKLPENDSHTVDGGMGAEELEAFYLANTGAFDVIVTYDMEVVGSDVLPVTETLTMVIDDFSKTLESRRGDVNLYSVSISLQEV
ncbi:MAG: hypothetical protein LC650_00970 [Actinobacteria bacterium]|nr:hypothetical protein [Actinomycetota bacterium]